MLSQLDIGLSASPVLIPYISGIWGFQGGVALCLEIHHTVRRGLKIGQAPGFKFDPQPYFCLSFPYFICNLPPKNLSTTSHAWKLELTDCFLTTSVLLHYADNTLKKIFDSDVLNTTYGQCRIIQEDTNLEPKITPFALIL